MRTKLIIEQMPKHERELPTKIWRLVKRQCTERGLSSKGYECLVRGVTLSRAQTVLQKEKRCELG